MTQIYHICPKTKEFTHASEADKDPLDKGKILLPAYATTNKSPKRKANEAAIFEGEQWNVVADYRGQKVEMLGREITIDKLGVSPEAIKPTKEELKAFEREKKRANLLTQLEDIDRKTIRPLREGDADRLQALAEKAQKLRAQLAKT